jgi:hypothetical protein
MMTLRETLFFFDWGNNERRFHAKAPRRKGRVEHRKEDGPVAGLAEMGGAR